MDTQISSLLQQIKGATGWSESKIAGRLRTSQPTVNRILNGQNDCKASTLRAIEALHQEVSETEAHKAGHNSHPANSVLSAARDDMS